MSHTFHKSCYTSRSSGYKYRTLSTNTGERGRRDAKEDTIVDKAFGDLHREISTRIDKELGDTERARQSIFDKFAKLDSKIDTMLQMQDDVLAMRKTLCNAETALLDLMQKVQRIEEFTSEAGSLKSGNSSTAPVINDRKCSNAEMAVSV